MALFKSKDRATPALKLILLIGVVLLFIRLLNYTDKFHTALLYVSLPFFLSLALYYLTPHTDGTTWKRRFWNNLRANTIIMFASSIVLMEGYICVIMFMPIFFGFALLAFIADFLFHYFDKGSKNAYILPTIVVLFSLEGVADETTFNRYNEVTYSQVIQADVATIKQRLSRANTFEQERHWLISIFPLPTNHVHATSLKQDDMRQYDFTYNRWFVANTHKGSLKVWFDEVNDDRIITRIEDTSYLSGYMKLHGSEMVFEPINARETKVSLTVRFDRKLDPIWYFEPLERFAVEKGARYFVTEILGKGDA